MRGRRHQRDREDMMTQLTDRTGAPVTIRLHASRPVDAYTVHLADGTLAGKADFVDASRAGVDADAERIFFHTEVDQEFGGRGLAKLLVREALEDSIRRNLTSSPCARCSHPSSKSSCRFCELSVPDTGTVRAQIWPTNGLGFASTGYELPCCGSAAMRPTIRICNSYRRARSPGCRPSTPPKSTKPAAAATISWARSRASLSPSPSAP